MDAEKSLKIATRRFQNGNYLLSLNKFGQARKEFEVALTIYERTDAYKETAETLNNIGIALHRDGQNADARDFLERSYALKKEKNTATKESMFNTLYNLLHISGVLTPDEFESYYIELKRIGEELGGDHQDIVEKEKAIYDSVVATRAMDIRRKQEEEQARSSPAGALEHMQASGIPCLTRVDFELHGFAIGLNEPITYLNRGKMVKIEGLVAREEGIDSTLGTVEFEAPYQSIRSLIESNDIKPVEAEAFEHLKKFMSTLVVVREEINFSLRKSRFSISRVTMKNAFGDFVDLYAGQEAAKHVPTVLNSEDVMLVKMMLSSDPSMYKLLTLNSRRLYDEEHFAVSIIESMTALNAFLNVLLRTSLTGDHLLDYTSIQNTSLYNRLDYLKRLLSGIEKGEAEGTLETYLGETGKDLGEAMVFYDRIMSGDKSGIGNVEAGKSLRAVSAAIYELKSRYGI
ncbi:tetratricopeptide repeat protein [Methanocella sp. MCL-LM]|uniref:tetratricopeptide repeat protein n=1 Tax=Methanocella sp. MCL-LM TaxID=3412035 RepID=UPI003C711E0E